MEIPDVIIFDVNETLLNMNPLKNSINSALQREYAADVWFAELLHYSLVDTVRDIYNDFSEIAEAVFKMNAKKYNLSFKDSEVSEVLSQVKKLEAYHDVIPALTELRSKGIKLVAFSNGKPEVLQDQLKYAGIDKYFYRIMSIEGCNKYKPHPAAYKYALQQLKSPAGKTMMIACHGWDIAGAQNQGMRTGFIERPGKHLYPLAQAPDLCLEGLTDLSKAFS